MPPAAATRLSECAGWHRIDHRCLLRVMNAGCVLGSLDAVQQLIKTCFPDVGASLDGAVGQEYLDQLVGYHDLEDCMFITLEMAHQDGGAAVAGLVGFTVICAYHDSVYVSCLCTHPMLRRQGLGTQMLLHAQSLAFELRLPKISGTVLDGAPDLCRYYAALGAAEQKLGFGSSGNDDFRGSVRFVKQIDAAEVGQNAVCTARARPRGAARGGAVGAGVRRLLLLPLALPLAVVTVAAAVALRRAWR